MKTLIILNEPAYGNRRTYNGLRLTPLARQVRGGRLPVFLMGDSDDGGEARPKTPDGFDA